MTNATDAVAIVLFSLQMMQFPASLQK